MLTMMALALAASAAAPATAPGGKPPIDRAAFVRAVDARYARIDADGNGRLDEHELDAAQARIVARLTEQRRNVATANFAAADANADGKVTLEEWIAAATAAPLKVWSGAELLATLDENRDGTVALEEYRETQLDRFDARDSDGDGAIDPGER